MLLDAQTNVKNTNFPHDNCLTDRIYRIDRMNDREQQLSECETSFTDGMNANWLTAVGNEITGKNFIPPDSTTIVVPYHSALQTNQFSVFE